MEDIYEKMSQWGEDKQKYDAHFWATVYPKMDKESKLIWWRKDVFNAMNKYSTNEIPEEWIAERSLKDPDFQTLMKEIIVKLS
jgi:hypothetical protein